MARAVMQQFTVGTASQHQTPVTPSSTVGHHTTNGTDISIRATAHGLEEGMIVTLAGWAWATGSGVIDGTYIVKTRTDANNFTLTPTTCPTNGSNPETVGTYSFARADDRVLKIAVDATYGTKVALPCGWWSVKHTAKTTAAAASTGLLAYRFTDSVSDVTLPDVTYAVDTLAKKKCVSIDPGSDEAIEIRRANSALVLLASTSEIVVFIRPSDHMVRG